MKAYNFIEKYKIWLIIALALVIAGTTLFSIFGFNKGYDVSGAYEVDVVVSESFGNTKDVVNDTANNFFSEKGLKYIDKVVIDDGQETIYVFNAKIDATIASELQTRLQTALSATLTVEVFSNQTKAIYNQSQIWRALIILVCAIVLAGVYMAFRYKFVATFTASSSVITNLLLLLAFVALTRIPVTNAFLVVAISSVFLTYLLNVLLFGDIKNSIKLSQTKNSNSEYVVGGLNKLVMPAIVLLGITLISAILMFVLGSILVKYLALQLLAMVVIVIFNFFFLTGGIWLLYKNYGDAITSKKSYKGQQTEETNNK